MKKNIKRIPNLEKFSIFYTIGKNFFRVGHNWFFYKQVLITGKHNVPENEPILLVANHQNALMDPAIINLSVKKLSWQPVFLARSDIFNNKILIKIFYFFKILPIYRIRDGKEALKKNEQIFNKTIDILEKRKILAMFPEANHQGKRKLRTIHKGVSRIFFQAEKKNDFKLGVKILPIGIYYSNYYSFRSKIQINIGEPIKTTELLELFKENENKAHRELRDKISQAIKPLIINIENDDLYDMYENLREIYDKPMLKKLGLKKFSQRNKFKADQILIEKLTQQGSKTNNPEINTLNTIVSEYTKKIKKNKIRDWVIENKKSWFMLFWQIIFLILYFPFFLFGIINNFPMQKLPKLLTKKFKDRNFHTSVEFSIYVFLYPIYYLIIFFIVRAVFTIDYIEWIYLVFLPLSNIFAHWYYIKFVKVWSKLKYYFAYNTEKYKNIRNLRHKIINIMDKITK